MVAMIRKAILLLLFVSVNADDDLGIYSEEANCQSSEVRKDFNFECGKNQVINVWKACHSKCDRQWEHCCKEVKGVTDECVWIGKTLVDLREGDVAASAPIFGQITLQKSSSSSSFRAPWRSTC